MSGVRAQFKPPRPLSASASSVQTRKPVNNSTRLNQRYSDPNLQNEASCQQNDPIKRQKTHHGTHIYKVQWRKKSTKKNKTWDGDGKIEFDGTSVVLKIAKSDGKYGIVGRNACKSLEGIISIGRYEVEVDEDQTEATEELTQSNDPITSIPVVKPFVPPKIMKTVASDPSDVLISDQNEENHESSLSKLSSISKDSLILKKPSMAINEVVVDPILTQYLRPHQKEGVAFLYECVMGMRVSSTSGNGALLADEMGLGKTLMTICLIWTLLKQSPYGKTPIANKILITCPMTLIGNWKREFKKWLGNKVSVMTLNNKQTAIKDKQDIKNFGKTKVYQVMILNYEKILSCSEELLSNNFDLLVCDEGHRLKNSSNKVVKILNELNIKRKIILTGTPIQNDLAEFYNIVNFLNPGVIGTFASFQKNFIKPISRAREVNCIDKEIIRIGEAKSVELVNLTKNFTLRRTNSTLAKYLTPKTDIILFCPPTKQQRSLFQFVFQSQKFKKLFAESLNDSLALILLFKKICNSPSLMAQDKIFQSLNYVGQPLEKNSGKINVLIPLLIEIKNLNEKTVIISNYTQTLELLEDVLKKLNILFLRLDGSTAKKDRDRLVQDFNNLPTSSNSVFLLSAKSGGVGLNLIGASRLILFDNDWNPSVDLQAMARIHRDGQVRPVFIYRLLTTGCIDEKIFQRQLMKTSLSDKFIDNKNESINDIFDTQDLKDIFTITDDTKSNTHDLLECDCTGSGEELDSTQSTQHDDHDHDHEANSETIIDQNISSSQSLGWMTALDYKQVSQSDSKKRATFRSALQNYRHFDPQQLSAKLNCNDEVLTKIIDNSPNCITYFFTKYNTNKLE